MPSDAYHDGIAYLALQLLTHLDLAPGSQLLLSDAELLDLLQDDKNGIHLHDVIAAVELAVATKQMTVHTPPKATT